MTSKYTSGVLGSPPAPDHREGGQGVQEGGLDIFTIFAIVLSMVSFTRKRR